VVKAEEVLLAVRAQVAVAQADMQVQVAPVQLVLLLLVQDLAAAVAVVAVVMADQEMVEVAVVWEYLAKAQMAPAALVLIKTVKVVQVVLMDLSLEDSMEEEPEVVKVVQLPVVLSVLFVDLVVHSPQPILVTYKNINIHKKALRSLLPYYY
jgi:hypothetical protein